MSGNLITIGKSGASAARAALELTGQNIANAGNATYARRTLGQSEVVATGGIGLSASSALSGVRADGVQRTQSLFLQNEVRRTNSDVSRADAELRGLKNAESAIEQAGIYPAIVNFEAALSQLVSDPLDGALRANALESANTLTQTFAIATEGMGVAADELRFDVEAGVTEFNTLSAELARTNIGLARSQEGSANKAALLDQRDALLTRMSGLANLSTEFDSVGRVAVRAGGAGGQTIVSGAQAASISVAFDGAGNTEFSVGGTPLVLGSGSLAGQAQGLRHIADLSDKLDGLAAQLIERGNTAQAAGITPAGTQGQPLFSGTNPAISGLR
ncbi:flagellar hook-associated protein FlgK [Erythrobacter sp. 3-20A1M]|uniref:FlgK family flagellar hook-associated protein n=1 Tax=Erythrobacter sp. 3-20A1M TaxID=2653850 RepID=UPI001BFC7B19|nr:flagellar hook-associated protein FlgK [Erythrobacter sp. 3-20A1M]QWC57423.1 flagellar hook-associated protein FlgK [Erythrobacter sp. 3-20A1M]